MPGKDGTGPLGQGPRAGRGAGLGVGRGARLGAGRGAGLGAGGGAGQCRGPGQGRGLRGRGRMLVNDLEPLRQKEAELEKELAATRKQLQELDRNAAHDLP